MAEQADQFLATRAPERQNTDPYHVTLRLDEGYASRAIATIHPDGTVAISEGMDAKALRKALENCNTPTQAHSVLFGLAFHAIKKLEQQVEELKAKLAGSKP